MFYLVAPASDVLFEDLEKKAEHFAGAVVGVVMGRGAVYQSAAELYTVGIVFASGMVGEASHKSHVILQLSLQNVKCITPVPSI